MINRLEPGARQISASGWNEIRDKINNLSPGQNTILTGAKNPFLINVKNNASSGLDILSVVKIGNATYANRTEAVFKQKAAECGTELNVSTPSGETDDIAILQQAIPAGRIGKAVADGCTPAFIYKDEAEHTYKYAKPIQNHSDYLKGCDEATNIRVLWHGTGAGKVNAYICLDATGEGDPLKVAAKMPNTDPRPEGAFYLDTTDTWLYADAIDSIAKKNDSNPPAIANPCGYPIDRPVIIGKCLGFEGIEDESESSSGGSSSNNNPEPEAVALACDVREFFMLNEGSSSSSITDGSNNNLDPNYSYGALEYISYNPQTQRWTPYTGSDAYKYRLAVCQRDLPADWSREYRMPYQTPEMNYGAQPWTANDSQSSSGSYGFTERCGVEPGEHEFSNKRLDYHYVNGRYSYEPRFVFIGTAKAGSGTGGVAITIENNDYDVDFPSIRSATSQPDIYAGDQITVEVNAGGAEPVLTAIDYPMDFAEGTVILTHDGKPGRGWEDVTDEMNNGDLSAGNGDILVWKNPNSKIIAQWTTHICTCTGGGGSGSGGGGGTGHSCPHDKILTANIRAKWWRKVKYDGGNRALK